MVISDTFIFAVVCRKCSVAHVDVLFKKYNVNVIRNKYLMENAFFS
ncbi:hypothetical protein CNEO3_520010 [Clostridium neonatale]|nr:hypothetical protein CNEO3_520010 [Clostridium neonatale]